MLDIQDKQLFGAVVADAIIQAHNTCKDEDTRNRWINAIGKAAAFIDNDTTFLTWLPDAKTLLIFSNSNEIYSANGTCQCEAFKRELPCYHRAMSRLVYNYNLISEAKPEVINKIKEFANNN